MGTMDGAESSSSEVEVVANGGGWWGSTIGFCR